MGSSSATPRARPDRSADPDYIGHAVVDGRVQYFSPSQLQKGDPESSTGCPRAWFYSKVLRMPEPTTKAQGIGIAGHSEIQNYLETGIRALSRRAISGLRAMPPPGSEMLVELPLLPRGGDGKLDLARAPLHAAGIPVFGKIDLLHAQGINYGAPGDPRDPDGTVEVCDWKFSKDLKHAKAGRDLADTIQMSGYGKFALQVLPDTRHVRLSHGYFPLKGEFEKRTHLFEPDQILRGWERAERVGGYLVEAAAATSADQVPGNARACKAFGKDCAFAPICSIKKSKTLSVLFGITAADRHLDNLNRNRPGEPAQMTTAPTTTAGDALRAKLAASRAATAIKPATGAPAPVPPAMAGPTAEEIAAEKSRLEIARANLKYPGLRDCWDAIIKFDVGRPVLLETAAAAIAAVTGAPIPEPSGELAEYALTDPGQIAQLLEAITEHAEKPAEQVATDIVSPETPEIERNATTTVPASAEPAKPDTVGPAIAAVGDKRKAGRPAGSRNKAKPDPAPAPPVEVVPVAEVAAPPAIGGKINVFINCTPSVTCTSLWPLFHEISREMTDLSGAADFRITEPSKEDKFAYGRWAGVLAAFVRSTDAGLVPGNYSFYGSGGVVALEFAAAIRQIAHESGGLVVVGA